MPTIPKTRLETLLHNAHSKRIAVIGDVMIDKYIWGSISRISPEAPVPVVEVEQESLRLGGAANVANNIASLGGKALMLGVTGDDRNGLELCRILTDQGASVDGIVKDPTRPTTVKTRVIAHEQHVVRIDSEDKKDIDAGICKQIVSILEQNMDTLDGIIIEDYNKGVITKDLIKQVIDRAARAKKIISVDPKFNNFFEYKNVTVFKPNKKETEEALGVKLKTEADILNAGALLLDRLNAGHVLMTRSEKGMSLFSRKGEPVHIPTAARSIANVSGAGDTVIATLTMMLASGATMEEASMIANYAGGVVCGEVGIVPIDPAALVEAVKN